MFIDGLRPQTKQLLDASVGGKIKLKTPEEIITKTIGNLPTKLSIGQPTHSFVLQVTGCTICGEAHETGQCIPIEENTQEVHYMGNQQRQGYTQGGFSGFQQGPYNQQGQWRSHLGNQSTRTRVDLLTGQPYKGLTSFKGILS